MKKKRSGVDLMKWSLIFLSFGLGVSVWAKQAVVIRVIGDRVSLRSEANLDRSEILDRAMKGEELKLLDRKEGWVGVQAPLSINFWVSSEFVDNGVVKPKRLNVRSGPSKNYNVVNVLSQGDRLSVRGEFNGWVKIAPPAGSCVWISEDYVELVNPPSKVGTRPIAEIVGHASKDAAHFVKDNKELKPLVLVQDKSKTQGVYGEKAGILQRANPGLFKLVIIHGNDAESICLVRGNDKQLSRFLNRSLLIKGHIFWAKGVALPIIQPQILQPDPLLKQ